MFAHFGNSANWCFSQRRSLTIFSHWIWHVEVFVQIRQVTPSKLSWHSAKRINNIVEDKNFLMDEMLEMFQAWDNFL